MNAVNLIPTDRRKANVSVSASPVTLGLIGGLVVVLIAAILYVLAANDVKSRQGELARVTANTASWQAAANSYASYVTAAQQRKQQIGDVHQLVAQVRDDPLAPAIKSWRHALGQRRNLGDFHHYLSVRAKGKG